jgi:hypothetical protein
VLQPRITSASDILEAGNDGIIDFLKGREKMVRLIRWLLNSTMRSPWTNPNLLTLERRPMELKIGNKVVGKVFTTQGNKKIEFKLSL